MLRKHYDQQISPHENSLYASKIISTIPLTTPPAIKEAPTFSDALYSFKENGLDLLCNSYPLCRNHIAKASQSICAMISTSELVIFRILKRVNKDLFHTKHTYESLQCAHERLRIKSFCIDRIHEVLECALLCRREVIRTYNPLRTRVPSRATERLRVNIIVSASTPVTSGARGIRDGNIGPALCVMLLPSFSLFIGTRRIFKDGDCIRRQDEKCILRCV